MRAAAVATVLAMLLAGCTSAAPAAKQQRAPTPRATPVGWQRPLVRITTQARRGLGTRTSPPSTSTPRPPGHSPGPTTKRFPQGPTRTSTSWCCTVTSRAASARTRPAALPRRDDGRVGVGAPHAAAAGVRPRWARGRRLVGPGPNACTAVTVTPTCVGGSSAPPKTSAHSRSGNQTCRAGTPNARGSAPGSYEYRLGSMAAWGRRVSSRLAVSAMTTSTRVPPTTKRRRT
jgi:hypothetical protein